MEEIENNSPIELTRNEVDIVDFTYDNFLGNLSDPANTSIQFSSLLFFDEPEFDDNPSILTTDKNSPSVLIEDGGSFCSIILTIDSEGNGVMLHQAFTGPSSVDDLEFNDYDTDVVNYRRKVKDLILRNQNITIVTGLTDSTERNSNLVVEALKEFLGQSYSNVKRFSEPSDLKRYDIAMSGGLIFIPKQLSKNGRNIVMFIGGKNLEMEKVKSYIKGKVPIQSPIL